ncbi:MAG: magnesium chelatase subunit D family protein [Isosphaeraceae bacterium]|nr:magnesium chelatase subunit D family protein [Isosphaeraceae bacterium]
MVGEAIYPFSAIVGQEPMKRALILAAIHPGLGGVVIRGSKGAAKSTAVRALAALLPEIEVYEGDPFHRAPGEDVAGWPLPEGARLVHRPVALVNLPVGATDDRVVGSLNLERALATGARHFEPGLLAAAHRGILYIDEVNLLGDHLVDLLLDAAAMGVNHVEREGLAFRHPARFVLVGTMNPEEGDLRPQLLDRFGLAVEVEPMTDPADRAEVVRRRLAFEADPKGFLARWAEADRREGERIAAARRLLPSVVVPEPVLQALCALCAREGADGLRADLTIYKAASALAAYEGRTEVTLADIEAVAELALAHRRTSPPPRGTPPPRDDDRPSPERPSIPPKLQYIAGGTGPDPSREGTRALSEPGNRASTDDAGSMQVLAPSEPESLPRWMPRIIPSRRESAAGRRGKHAARDRRGTYIGATFPNGHASDPALVATLRAAAPWQVARGRSADQNVILRPSDLRVKVRVRPPQHLVLFVVDASRSMGARERMRQTKAAVLSLLVDAYQKRDRVGLITFGKGGARLVLPPTRSVRVAARQLADLPIGGTTPLAEGLALAGRVVAAMRRREAGITPLVVLLTDGRGNLPMAPGGDPEAEAMAIARQLAHAGITGLVIDTEAGPVRLGMARSLAEVWGADLKTLDEWSGPRLPEAIRRALFARIA